MTDRLLRFIVLLLVSVPLFAGVAQGQLYFNEDMVPVKGQVIDEITKQPIGYAQVINYRVRGGTMTDVNGKFVVQADPADTLTFKSLNYKDKKVPVKAIYQTEGGLATITLTPVKIMLGQVEVTGNAPKVNMQGIPVGKSVSTPVELRSNYFNSNPKLLTAAFHPLSYMSYKLSKSEKEKRTTLKAIHNEHDWQILSLVYNKEVIQRISGLSGDALEDFMLYCNAYSNLPVNASTYEVEKRIRDLFLAFQKKNLSKSTSP